MNTASVITFDSISQEQLDTITGGIDWEKVGRQGAQGGLSGGIAGVGTGAITGLGAIPGAVLGAAGGFFIGAVGEIANQVGL